MDILLGIALSAHLGLEGDYNSIHPHVRVEHNQAIAGAYYNSEEKVSLYGGYRFEPIDSVGVELGVVNGYPAIGGVTPYIRGTYDSGNTRFFIAPGAEKRNEEITVGAVIGIEFLLK